MDGMKKWLGMIAFFTIFLIPVLSFADVPVVSDVFVTDVTPKSFSVIWASSEASTADIEVYEDEAGTTLVTGIVIEPHPVNNGDAAIKTAAENNGVMKVRVTGLDFDTTYYFQTITTSTTDDTTLYPASAPLMSVTTEVQTVRTYEDNTDILPFSNDIIIEECYLEDGVTPAAGTLLVATVAGGNYPLTAFVGDGVASPYALIDLNNMYSRATFTNLDLLQDENLTLVNFRGIAGNSIVTHKVPEDFSLSEVKEGAFALKVGSNMISMQLESGDTETLSVLDPIIDTASAIYTYDSENGWVFYERDGWPFLNTLNNLHAYTGYYIFMDEEASLKVDGIFSSSPIQLKAGVGNLVGYHSIETLPLLEAMESISDYWESVWIYENGQWVFYDRNGWPFLNTLTQIEPGKSYWVYVSSDCTWE